MNPAILAVSEGKWQLLSEAMFWSKSLKETIQGFSSVVFYPWEELCASGFQLEKSQEVQWDKQTLTSVARETNPFLHHFCLH